jgi:CBS domain-containing protein
MSPDAPPDKVAHRRSTREVMMLRLLEAKVANYERGDAMQVRDGMSRMVLTVGPGHTLRAAARLMSERRVGAAVVLDPDAAGPGILTERDVLDSIGQGQDPDVELVGEHLTSNVVFAAPDWSLEDAAAAMVGGSFRHLVVFDQGEIVGILSVRDVVRCWTDDGATCDIGKASPGGSASQRVLA